MAEQRAAELSPPGAAGARWSRPARRGREDSAVPPPGAARPPAPPGAAPARCSPRPAAAAPSHPIPSRPGKQRADFPNSLKCGRAARLPRVPAAVRSRPPPLCPARPSAGRGVAHAPSPRARRGRDSGGTPLPAAVHGDRRCRPRSRCGGGGKSPCSRSCPFPSRAPGAAALGSVRGALRGAPRAAPGAFPGLPRVFRNLPPGAAGTGPAARPEEPRWTEGRLQYVLFREALHHPP